MLTQAPARGSMCRSIRGGLKELGSEIHQNRSTRRWHHLRRDSADGQDEAAAQVEVLSTLELLQRGGQVAVPGRELVDEPDSISEVLFQGQFLLGCSSGAQFQESDAQSGRPVPATEL